jgi:hypothetical protein
LVLPKKCMFTVKTSQKLIFLLREAYILSQLDITVLYTIFLGFGKYQVSTENPKGLAFGLTENHLFMIKISQKYVFHHHDAHNLSRLDVLVM